MRHTREDVVERTRREYQRLDRLIKTLKPADWRRRVPRPETKDPWTVKDALVHIVYWKAHSARVFRGEKGPAEIRGLDINDSNALIYRRWRRRRPAEVVTWHREVQADVMQTLRKLPDDWFSRREHRPDWPGDFDGHSAGHRLKDIQAALDSPPD